MNPFSIHEMISLLESQEFEARFRAIFQSSAIGMGLLTLDGKILRVNEAAIKMSGCTEAELLQHYDQESIYPDDQDVGTDLLQDLRDGTRDWFQVERRYIRKNGEVFWARVTLSVVRDWQGNARYLMRMMDDIDAQKSVLASLQESEARFRALFENSGIGMVLIGADRRVLDANLTLCRMLGYMREELIGEASALVIHPEDYAASMKQYHDLLTGETDHFVTELRYRRKDGTYFWGQVSMSMVYHADGTPRYLVGMIADIDAQKEAQARLAEQEADYLRTLQQRVEERTHELAEINQRLKEEIEERLIIEEQLAKKAAEEAVNAERTRLARDLHDAVTQSLFSASLIAEVLPELWQTDLEEAQRSTEELRQLTRGALAEMRMLLLELRPSSLTRTRLADLIRQLCEAFIGRSRLPIVLTVEGDSELPPEVQVAVYRIAQESLNNVFKYARASRVNVNLFLSPANVHFETCDNGAGFDMSLNKPTSLGMRIMRERAEAIGAALEITSAIGKGTCVQLTWRADPRLKLRVL
jgi:PAS domain S-box-containing protein